MNAGGDPGHDDYGLPPVDIEIPDDARELDHDIQAYYRELRARRRRLAARRLWAPLARDGMVLPLLAGCLALTLLAGTLLTVFTAQPPPARQAAPAQNAARGANLVPRTPSRPPPLPAATVLVGDRRTQLSRLPGRARLLAMVPPRCGCDRDVRRLAALARHASVRIYLVGTGRAALTRLSRKAHLGRAHVAVDVGHVLRYQPALMALLVKPDGSVARTIVDPAHDSGLRPALRALASGPPPAP